jgi:hypothetical protein
VVLTAIYGVKPVWRTLKLLLGGASAEAWQVFLAAALCLLLPALRRWLCGRRRGARLSGGSSASREGRARGGETFVS